ncbi:MAG: four helix bundle suffix domain-containing protein, partial [Prevotella fusca]
IQVRTDETIANIAITLIYQEDVILRKYLDRIKDDFIKHGGIREQMTKARIEYRNKR